MEKVDFGKFGKAFQEKLGQLLLDDAGFANQVGEVLDFNYFELKYLQLFSKLVFDYKVQYGKYPSRSTIETILRSEISGENETLQKQVRDYYARIVSDTVSKVDEEFVKHKSLDFCRKQKLRGAFLKSIDLMESSDFDEISQIINEALKLGSDNETGYKFIEQFEQRYDTKARKPISTGWDVIDKLTKSGLGSGELGVVIAPTGAGKSMILTHLGAAALKLGKKVVHYTLELSDTSVGLRYDACLTGVSLNSLMSLKDEVFNEIVEVPGKLTIKEYPTKSATTETIKNHLSRILQRGEEIDMVIVDYADLLRPRRYSKEVRHNLETIYEELRGIAQEFEVPLWTASQTNRSGLNAEVITMEAISEAFSKCFVADFIFTSSRTIIDKQTNGGRFFIAKSRLGPDGIICPIHMDTSKVFIDVFEPTGDTIAEVEKVSAKKQEERMKEKYRNYKGNK